VASGLIASVLVMSVRRRAKQVIVWALAGAQAAATLAELAAEVAASAVGASSTPAVSTAAAPIAMNTGGLTRMSPPMQGVRGSRSAGGRPDTPFIDGLNFGKTTHNPHSRGCSWVGREFARVTNPGACEKLRSHGV
jgi:hypothetical protein